jgi:hypothetical protein
MKFIAVTIFILLLLTQSFSKWLMVAGYTINKDFIAKNLCENRDKPKLLCNGKCQLAKKMAAEESSPNSSNGSVNKLPFSEVWCNDVTAANFSFASPGKPLHNSFYLIKETSSFLSSIFHPPLA